ncbi:MAG TPA: uroporphyrinogen decarboxylase family protein [Spirochaetia bacterium]|nr:uroporphyrinogen decarboxylase family protein [Spirochaetia bacterium]
MKELTSRERIHRCYNHLEVDRPGVYIRWGGMEDNQDVTYRELKRLVLEKTDRKQLILAEQFVGSPPIKSYLEPYDQDFDCRVTLLETSRGNLVQRDLVGRHGQPGYRKEHFLKEEADAEKYLSLPYPDIGGDCSAFFAALETMGDRGVVESDLGLNPASIVVELFGTEIFAILSIEGRETLHRLMARECEIKCRLVRYLLERGIGPYFAMSGEEYLVPPLHGREDFFDFNVRYDRPITDLVHDAGARVHVHCHGSIESVIDGFVALGADVLHPFEAPPLGDITPKKAKEALRGKVTLEGNIQIGDMYGKHPGEIRDQVRDLIADGFEDHRGLIVCPTASPYIPGAGERCTPNYRAMVEAVLSASD